MALTLPTAEDIRAIVREQLAEQLEPLLRELAQLRGRRARSSPDAEHIGIAKLAARLGKGRSTIAAWCRAGTFPKPHHCGQQRCWTVAEVEAWEAARTGGGGAPEGRLTALPAAAGRGST